MVEKASLEFTLRKFDEIRNYLTDETKHNELMSGKYKKTCKCLNYVENLLILVSAITDCVSISPFSSLVDIDGSIMSSAVGINIFAIIAGIKKYKSIIKKKKKKHDKIGLLGKDELNTIEFRIYKFLIDSYFSHDKFASVNNILREYGEMKEEIKNPETSSEYTIWKWLIQAEKRIKEMV